MQPREMGPVGTLGVTGLRRERLFTAGAGGYARYRIPALVVTARGTVLAFCEARRFTGRDADEIDLLLRRSTDGGETFDLPRRILGQTGWVYGNPAPVTDRETGTTWLLFCRNRQGEGERMICRGEVERSVWVTGSDDDGLTWRDPVEITTDVKRADWGWYATGPGHGIQLRSGRLLISCNHSPINRDPDQETPYFAHVIWSDDHGRTWSLGGSVDEGTNESTAVELDDGRVCLNARNSPWSLQPPADTEPGVDAAYVRAVAWSSDDGESFSAVHHDAALPEPICQGSLLGLAGSAGDAGRPVLFANPAGPGRAGLTVRRSDDGCESWPVARTLHAGPAAYSDLCQLGEDLVACLYEAGTDGPYEGLDFARFSLDWLAAVDPGTAS